MVIGRIIHCRANNYVLFEDGGVRMVDRGESFRVVGEDSEVETLFIRQGEEMYELPFDQARVCYAREQFSHAVRSKRTVEQMRVDGLRAKELHDKGMGVEEIADRLGISVLSVRRHLYEFRLEDIDKRNQEIRKLQGKMSTKDIATKFKVSESTVRRAYGNK